MSALTKIFVVLLVILSLLLSAATIVFVNTQNSFVATVNKLDTTNKELRTDNARLTAALQTQEATQRAALAEKDNQINQAHNDLAAAQQAIAQRDAQIAESTANLASATVTLTTLGDALKAAQVVMSDRDKGYNELRSNFDKQQKQLVDLNLRVDDLTNVADVRGRGLKVANEQIAQLNQDLSKANAIIKQNGLPTVDTVGASAPINPEPSINVTARIQETRNIGGVRYATINVGSADSVEKNMQLSIIDPAHNKWLGYIVVDQVFPHEAYGRIDGPNANQVQQGALVKSRLK